MCHLSECYDKEVRCEGGREVDQQTSRREGREGLQVIYYEKNRRIQGSDGGGIDVYRRDRRGGGGLGGQG